MAATRTLTARTVAALVKAEGVTGFRFVSYGPSVQVVPVRVTDEREEAALRAFLTAQGFTVAEDDLGYPLISR